MARRSGTIGKSKSGGNRTLSTFTAPVGAKGTPRKRPGPLPSEKSAKTRARDRDALRCCRVLIGSAYRLAGDSVAIRPALDAFGDGVPYDISLGVSRDAEGNVSIKGMCRVDGREIELEA